MLKEIRKMKDNPKKKYIYFLIGSNKIEGHINNDGYICYDTEELKNFQKKCKKGRPPKIK